MRAGASRAPLSCLEPHGRPRSPGCPMAPQVEASQHQRSANPMPFPRLLRGDIISVMSRDCGALSNLLMICYGRQILNLEEDFR
jgi:hypothetical protein